jgi:ATP-dependent Zn protease
VQHSEKLEEAIDEEIQEIIEICYAEAKEILMEKRKELDKMARLLLEEEKIDDKDIKTIVGARPD